jgi:drug/metabolite transporter (DMT)-like permease
MAVALALTASLAYGVANYVGPRLARGDSLFVLLIAGQSCSFVLALGVVAASGDSAPGAGAIGAALVAGLGNAGGLILFYRAAAIGPLSIVTPLGAIGAAVPVAVGLATGEHISVIKGAGIALALAGGVLVARRPGEHEDADAHTRRETVLLAGASAVCFGIFLTAMEPAADESAGWAVAVSRVSLLALLAAVAVRLGALARTPARRLPLLAVPGVLLFVGTVSYASALNEGDLSVVAVLGSLFPVVTVGLAIGLDGERLSASRLLGVAAAIAGTVLLSVP